MKKYIVIFVFFICSPVFGGELHRTGLIYEDPRTVPWLQKKELVEVKLPLPDSVDHSANMPHVGDQGGQGSCTAWAVGYYYKTYQEWQEHEWGVDSTDHQFSPAFIYNQINGGEDRGAYLSDAFRLLCDNGCANLVDCPYDPSDYTTWPSETAYENAIPFRCDCDSAYYIDCSDSEGVENLKQHIANGNVAVIGMRVWPNFYNISDYNNTYCVADTTILECQLGHAVAIVGYNDNKNTNDGPGAFRLVNSWGTWWGDSGYFWMSYEAIKHPRLSHLYAYYSTDKIGYTPTILLRWEINHPARGAIQLKTGVGSSTSPLWTKDFFDWRQTSAIDHPFPSHNIVFDISEGVSYIDSTGTNVFLSCRDKREDGKDGSVKYLSAQHLEWGVSSISKELPKPIPDNGDTIYVNLTIPEPQKTIRPDTIPIGTPTAVKINVSTYTGNPLPDVEIKISGWGLSPSLYDTTDGLGQCQIPVNAPYGEVLSVSGRKLTESETMFEENLYVIGGFDLEAPELSATIPPFGSYDTLATMWETIIAVSSGDADFTIYARSSNLDTSTFVAGTSGELIIVPQAIGEVTIVLGKVGYNVYTKVFSVKSVLPVSGTWTTANSPYQVMSHLEVKDGKTLTIEPGVVVDFQGYCGFYVYGLLEAVGTVTDSIYFTTDKTANRKGWGSIRFVNADDASKLEYCRIEFAKFPENYAYFGGSGIYCDSSNPTITNNTITGNSAYYGGGGIYCEYSNPIITSNTIIGNSATEGGGIYCYKYSNPIITDNTIIGSSAARGGGISCGYCSNPTITNNTIIGNSGLWEGGGGIFCGNADPTITNNTIIGNSGGSDYGGGISCVCFSDPTIINNTIIGNSAAYGGGIYCGEHYGYPSGHSTPTIVNTILYFNTASEGSQIKINNAMYDTLTISYCDIQDKDGAGIDVDGGIINWRDGNIDADPLFVDTANGNYRLQGTSPCIDAGIPDTTGLNLPPTDIEGNIRIWDGDSNGTAIIDMGTYEFGAPPWVEGVEEEFDDSNALLLVYSLSQNYPNPMGNVTQIEYALPTASCVSMRIYNILGQLVKTLVDELQEPGQYSISWNGRDEKGQRIASGVYFYRFEAGDYENTKKMILLR